MGPLFSNSYVFGFTVALLTAGLVYVYQQSVEPDPEANKKTFYKTLAAGVTASFAMAYIVNRPQPVSTEPFSVDAVATVPSPTPTPSS